MESVTGRTWHFHLQEPDQLSSEEVHRPADFLDTAALRMVEGPFDLILVITDVGLASRRQRVVAGLASEISRSRSGLASTCTFLMEPTTSAVHACFAPRPSRTRWGRRARGQPSSSSNPTWRCEPRLLN